MSFPIKKKAIDTTGMHTIITNAIFNNVKATPPNVYSTLIYFITEERKNQQKITKASDIPKLFCNKKTGNVLLSQAVSHQVSSALRSLTTVFEMGTGVTSSP